MSEPTLRELRQGQEPIWTFVEADIFMRVDESYNTRCKHVRCTKHLPNDAKSKLEQVDKDPQWFPPQYIWLGGGNRWEDNLTSVTWSIGPNDSYSIVYKDTRQCSICTFQKGIEKVRGAIYGKKFIEALMKKWITPGADGTCGYSQWSWRKMQQECGVLS